MRWLLDIIKGWGNLPADVYQHVLQSIDCEALRPEKCDGGNRDMLNDNVVPFYEEHGTPPFEGTEGQV
jgi:hypothetical protein